MVATAFKETLDVVFKFPFLVILPNYMSKIGFFLIQHFSCFNVLVTIYCDIDKKSNYSTPRVGCLVGTRAILDIMIKREISDPAVK